MSLQVVVPPTEEPVSLEEARAFSAGGYADLTDAQLSAMISSARIRLERYLGRAIAEQTLALHKPCFPYGRIVLTWAAPLQEVEELNYRPYGGGSVIGLEEDLDYVLDQYAEPAVIYPSSGGWPTTAPHPMALSVIYVAGWPQAEVPEPIKGAILGEVAMSAANVAAGSTSGDVRSMAIEGLGTITYQTGGGSSAVERSDAMLQPSTRILVDSYRIAWA
jgi:uncharacterized phiE125 gp8 family phage protein